jgi:hypothetical protein
VRPCCPARGCRASEAGRAHKALREQPALKGLLAQTDRKALLVRRVRREKLASRESGAMEALPGGRRWIVVRHSLSSCRSVCASGLHCIL